MLEILLLLLSLFGSGGRCGATWNLTNDTGSPLWAYCAQSEQLHMLPPAASVRLSGVVTYGHVNDEVYVGSQLADAAGPSNEAGDTIVLRWRYFGSGLRSITIARSAAGKCGIVARVEDTRRHSRWIVTPESMVFRSLPPVKVYYMGLADRSARSWYEMPRASEVPSGLWLQVTELSEASHSRLVHDSCGPLWSQVWLDSRRPKSRISFVDSRRLASAFEARHGVKLALPNGTVWQYAARSGAAYDYVPKWARAVPTDLLIAREKDWVWASPYSRGRSQPIATKLPNKWGFFDMKGNLDELCDEPEHNVPADTWGIPRGARSKLREALVQGGSFNDSIHFRPIGLLHTYPAKQRSYELGVRFMLNAPRRVWPL